MVHRNTGGGTVGGVNKEATPSLSRDLATDVDCTSISPVEVCRSLWVTGQILHS